MMPEVPQQLPQGALVHYRPNATYYVEVDPSSRMSALAFRIPGLGWLDFGQQPDQELDRMHSLLQTRRGRLATVRNDTKH
jgi:hypothetical protein